LAPLSRRKWHPFSPPPTEEAADWIDRTVRVDKISAHPLDQWVREFLRLKKLNAEMIGKAKRPGKTAVESKRK
jgi:hypothetical protein